MADKPVTLSEISKMLDGLLEPIKLDLNDISNSVLELKVEFLLMGVIFDEIDAKLKNMEDKLVELENKLI